MIQPRRSPGGGGEDKVEGRAPPARDGSSSWPRGHLGQVPGVLPAPAGVLRPDDGLPFTLGRHGGGKDTVAGGGHHSSTYLLPM